MFGILVGLVLAHDPQMLGTLISETIVRPGEHYEVEEYGDLGKANQASLVCTYKGRFRKIVKVYWYSPADVFGRSACPLELR